MSDFVGNRLHDPRFFFSATLSDQEDLDVADTSKLWDEIDLIATASDMEEEDSEADGTDSVSIHSTPKPTLRPFFATTGSSDDTLSAVRSIFSLLSLFLEFLCIAFPAAHILTSN